MINLTVETALNHAFTVDDNMTVAEFKEKIAATVKIPAYLQKIICCRRILKDSSKLKEYDIHDKILHLIQRQPPSANQRQQSEFPPAQTQMPCRIWDSLKSAKNAIGRFVKPLFLIYCYAASALIVARRRPLKRSLASLPNIQVRRRRTNDANVTQPKFTTQRPRRSKRIKIDRHAKPQRKS